MKKIFSLLLVCLLTVCFAAPTLAESYRNVADEAEVLTATEEAELNRYAEELASVYSYDVVVYFAESLHQRDAQALADDFYDYNGYGIGEERSGILLMICPSQRQYAYSTCGDGYRMFDGERFEALDDATLDNMSNGEWYLAALNYMTTCERCFEMGMPDDVDSSLGIGPAVLISLFFGFLLSFIPMGIMRAKLKSVAKKTEASYYVAEDSVRVTDYHNRLVNVLVTRTPINQGSSGDGGRGGHISSSGTHHGGHSGRF